MHPLTHRPRVPAQALAPPHRRLRLGRDETPDGLRLRFRADPGVAAERDCCAWADWSVEPGDDEIALVVRASADGITALHAMLDVGT